MNHSQFNEILTKVNRLQHNIVQKREGLLKILTKYEPHATAHDELEKSLKTLKGLEKELYRQERLGYELSMASFLPLNLPLYSLILFCVVPLAHTKRVYVRPPKIMKEIIAELYSLLELDKTLPEIVIKDVSRAVFVNIYAKYSDVILFTGKYENAEQIRERCHESLFIYNGSGVNPAIVFANAQVEKAAEKIYDMRIFNSGQDCAGTDAIFVHEAVIDEFLRTLTKLVKSTKVGKYGRCQTQVGPIMRADYVKEVEKYLRENKEFIVHEGRIDHKKSMVAPYILRKKYEQHTHKYHEFFAPIFNLVVFNNDKQLETAFKHPYMADYSMYVSCFGYGTLANTLKSQATVIRNKTINDVEQGNKEYGGYGKKANFVAFGSQKAIHPVLITREIYNFYTRYSVS